jgi:hypothetical protein
MREGRTPFYSVYLLPSKKIKITLMGKKKNKKLAEILGDAQVVLFNKYQLDSTIQSKNNLSKDGISRLTLDLMGKNVLGTDLNTIHVHFLPDGEALPMPQSYGEYVICHQPMHAFAPMMQMIGSGIDFAYGSSFFYGTYTSAPPCVQFSLLSGELSNKQMLSMLKKDLEINQQDEVVEREPPKIMHHQDEPRVN